MRCARCNRSIKRTRLGDHVPMVRGEGLPCPVAFPKYCVPEDRELSR